MEPLRKKQTLEGDLPPLSFPVPPSRGKGDLVEIADGLLWLTLPMPYALNHVNVYLLRTDHGWLIVDTGIKSDETRELWEGVFSGRLKGERVCGVVCTHYHADHAGFAGYLTDRFRVPMYMSYEEYFTLAGWPSDIKEVPWEHVEFFRRAGLPEELLPGTLVMFDFSGELTPLPPSFQRIREGAFTELGGDWQIIKGEGHSPEHSLLYSEQKKLLFSGDQLLPTITSNISVSTVNPADEPLGRWFHSLEKLSELPDDVLVLPGHGRPFQGARTRVEELHRHHEGRIQIILDACAEGERTAYELVRVLYPMYLGDFDLQLALGECLAHLHYLESRNRLGSTLDGRGALRYHLM